MCITLKSTGLAPKTQTSFALRQRGSLTEFKKGRQREKGSNQQENNHVTQTDHFMIYSCAQCGWLESHEKDQMGGSEPCVSMFPAPCGQMRPSSLSAGLHPTDL